MTQIDLMTADQVLTAVQQPTISSGDQNSDRVQVEFDSMWAGYARSAVFYTEADPTVYEEVLTDDGCTIPHEVLAVSGILYIGVRGVNADNGKVKTSTLVKYKIVDGAPAGAGTTIDPTPTVFQQILTRLNDLESSGGKSVTDYGAKGDGKTDDTAAFQSALAENRVVFVPGGTYVLSDTLTIRANCCLELSQDTVLKFTQTSGNCINLGMLSNLKGNHATVQVPYEFSGNVLYAYSNDNTTTDQALVPPWTRWDPQWKTGRYVTDLNICKADSRGFHYAVNPDECKGTAVYISADYTVGCSTFMWGVHCSGLRIAGAFSYGIRAVNIDDGWLHDMRMDAFIDACEIGVSLEDCSNVYVSATVQPRQAYTLDQVYIPYAKHGIQLIRSKNVDLSGSRVWDWNATNTLWEQDNEYQHIAMIGDCRGAIINDFAYHTNGDTRKRIYTDQLENLDRLTILQEPSEKWIRERDGEPYFYDGSSEERIVLKKELDAHFDTDVVKNFTDVLPTATDTDGAIFNEVGYKNGYLNGSGAFVDSAYYVTTGFIPCAPGQTLYVNDMSYKTYDGFCRFCMYDTEKNLISLASAKNLVTGNFYYVGYEETDNGFKATVNDVVGNAGTTYVRFSVYKRNVGSNPMVAIDEPIKYTVEGFLADSVKIKGENVIGDVGVEQPDWVATKKLEGGDTVYIPEQTISSGVWSKLQISLQVGLTYDVILNGEVYACEARTYGSGAVLGNNSSMSLNDYPFCIQWAGGTAISGMFFKSSDISYPVTLKVTDHAYYVYDQMPEGYLPDCVVKSVNGVKPYANGNVEIEVDSGVDVTAEVGQTILVEEIDESGKPTKWKAVDYQPRTHWSKFEEIVPATEVTDFSTDDLGVPMSTMPICKLEVGHTYKVIFDGVEYTCVATAECLGDFAGVGIGNAVFNGREDTGEPFAIAYTDVLSYSFLFAFDTNAHSVRVLGEVPQKIPTKFVPTLEEMRITEAAVLEETTITDDSEPLTQFAFMPAVGDICEVTWNGTQYICEAKDVSEFTGLKSIALGNLDLAMDTGDTGEPFIVVIFSSGEGELFVLKEPESDSIVVSIKAEIATKIPAKYIPDEVRAYAPYYLQFVKDEDGDNFAYNPIISVAHLEAMIDSGRQVIAKLTYIEPLTGISAGTFYMGLAQELNADSKRAILFQNGSYQVGLEPQEDGTYKGTFGSID